MNDGEAQWTPPAGPSAEWASQINLGFGELLQRLTVVERRVAQLEAQLDAQGDRVDTRLEARGDRLEGALDRASREVDYRLYELERRMEGRR
jgi:hypothetical protein